MTSPAAVLLKDQVLRIW